MDISNLTEKQGRTDTKYYTNESGEIVAKACKKCLTTKELTCYVKSRKGLGGRSSRCKICEKVIRRKSVKEKQAYDREHYEANKESRRAYQRKRRAEYPNEFQQYREANRQKFNLLEKRRRSRKLNLPNTLTESQIDDVLNFFDGRCALTGQSDNIHLDHVIPLSIGDIGTVKENIIPLSHNLNSSKGVQNLFDWLPYAKETYEISQERINSLVAYLAEINGMTIEEYQTFVHDIHNTCAGKAN